MKHQPFVNENPLRKLVDILRSNDAIEKSEAKLFILFNLHEYLTDSKKKLYIYVIISNRT